MDGKRPGKDRRSMTRYRPEHKEATRQRIIETAGRRFKSDGLDGAGISTLVADAGLTNGAFYGHFTSKDDLIATVVAQQLSEQTARVAALPVGPETLERFIGEYLSPAHRDNVGGGCPSAALLDEIGRSDEGIRDAYTEGVRELIAAIARHLHAGDVGEAQERAVSLFCLLVGSMQTARAVTDRELSDRILATAQTHATALASPPTRPARPTRQDPR
jgi:TetR/AcrR family transcriptional regulator, transcriptional repressor for nem operon